MSYESRCPFCHNIHRSEFFDQIEDEIMDCRDKAPQWKRGDLSSFTRDTLPIRPETAAAIAEAEAASYIF